MEIVETVSTQKERFVVLKNGHIIREKGKFEPTKHEFDVLTRPTLPENLGNSERVCFNKVYDAWDLECEYADFKNYMAHQEQKKVFKKRVAELKKRYCRQESLRKKEERRKIYNQGISVVRSLISRVICGRERN